jgi:hypothetical protein
MRAPFCAALVVLSALAACAAPAVPEPRPVSRETPDEAVRRVLTQNGLPARIVRPWSAVQEAPSSGGKGVLILLAGSPGVEVVLDRDYWALAVTMPGQQSVSGWVLNPKDEQSALNIDLGERVSGLLDQNLAKNPGLTVTRQPGTVDGEAVEWRRWSDQHHLYSECAVRLAAKNDPVARRHRVNLIVTANTEERRQALEERLASLQLRFSAQ